MENQQNITSSNATQPPTQGVLPPQQPKRSKKKRLLIAVALVLVLAIGLIVVVSSTKDKATSNTNTSSRPYDGGKRDPKAMHFISNANKEKILATINNAQNLEDLGNNTTQAFASAMKEGFGTYSSYNAPPIVVGESQENSVESYLEGATITPLAETDLPLAKKIVSVFANEYAKYPIEWMRYASSPEAFVFAKEVKIGDDSAGGVTRVAIIYDIGQFQNISTPVEQQYADVYLKQLIHHEIAHWVDQQTFGTDNPYDRDWLKLNPGGVADYNSGYDLSSENNYADHPALGFISGYALTNWEEDKAEVYSYLFTKEGTQKLNQYNLKDPILKKKMNYWKDFIKKKVPGMDDSYFKKYIES